MDAKQEECTPDMEGMTPFNQEQENYPEETQCMYPYLTGELPALPVITSDQTDLANAQAVINNGNRRADGTLQQLEVGDSTVEVQGNGSHSFLHIVNSNTHVVPSTPFKDTLDLTVLQEQPETSTSANQYTCSHCRNIFRARGPKEMHERTCPFRNIKEALANRQCKECLKVFSSVSYLKAHMQMHSGTQTFRCRRCYRRYFDDSLYSAHMDWHKRQDELAAKGSALSAQHADKQLVVKEFKCLFCKQNFTAIFDVGQVKRRLSCDTCRQKYNSPEGQKQRQQRDFACTLCGRQFTLQGYLQRHQATCDGTLKRSHHKR